MNIPGGQLAQQFGAKPVLLAALAIASIATLLTPPVVHYGGSNALIVLRFVIGLSQGGLFPAINVLLAVWVPVKERGGMASFIYCGVPVGMMLGNSLCGILLERYAWPVAFYALGTAGSVFSILLVCVICIVDIRRTFKFHLFFFFPVRCSCCSALASRVRIRLSAITNANIWSVKSTIWNAIAKHR